MGTHVSSRRAALILRADIAAERQCECPRPSKARLNAAASLATLKAVLPLLIGAAALVLLAGAQLVFGWLGSRRRLRVERSGGVAVLRLARGRHLVLGVLALPPALLFLALPLAMRERGAPGLGLAAALALAALGVSAYFFAAEARKRMRVDEDGLERIGVLTRRRLAWADVEKIAHNPTSRWFVLLGRSGARIWISESFEGVGDFAEMALRKLPPAAFADDRYVREELEDLSAA